MGTANETAVIDSIRDFDPDLAQKIQDEMFVFENLMDLDDRSIQLLLREVQSESLIVALKGTSEELREKIFKNMSQRAAEMLRDDLEAKGRCGCPKWRPNRRKFSRLCGVWRTKARSCWAAKERKVLCLSKIIPKEQLTAYQRWEMDALR